MISMVLPGLSGHGIAVCTSPGFCALPSGMFSAAHTMPMTRTFGLSSAMARMAPIMAAPPAMSYFIFSMLSAGLMEMPPVSKVMPLPTRPSTGPSVTPSARSAARSAPAALPSPAHTLQNAPIFSSCSLSVEWTSQLQADFAGHLRGALAEDGRGELVARLVDQRAGEVLALADDDALGECGFGCGLVARLPGRPR